MPSVTDAFCLGHSPDPAKDASSLRSAFAAASTTVPLNAAGWVIPFLVDFDDKRLGDIDCRAATFLKEVRLRDSYVESSAFFNQARFKEPASFLRCQFRAAARFDGVVFEADADFESAGFAADAEFIEAEFRGSADFSWTVFTTSPSFSRARAQRGAKFEGTVFKARATFDQTWLGAVSRFDECDLSLVGFRGTRLTSTHLADAYGVANAEFESVIWSAWRRRPQSWVRPLRSATRRARARVVGPLVRQVSGARRLRGIVYEERLARTRRNVDDFRRAEKVYRELRRSAEARRDYLESNRLHIRELEMRRLRKGVTSSGTSWLRSNVLSLEALYRVLSFYGMRSWQPAAWLALFLFVLFPLLFAVSGFEVNGLAVEVAPIDWPWTWSAYGHLVAHTVRVASLVSDPQGPAGNAAIQSANASLRVIGPFLALLVTLAVRRRFRS